MGKMQTPLVLLRFLRCPPTKVAETISFTVFLEPWIKKPLVFIAFEHLLLGTNAKSNSFMLFSALAPDQGCSNHLFYCVFAALHQKSNGFYNV